jgi:class 3 adenylate cyclase
VPLCADSRGQILPHISLAIACAQLGVDPKQVRYGVDRVTIPTGDSTIEIPVRSIDSRNYGRASMFMDIPWFGSSDPTVMYDAPNYKAPRQRMPIRNIWSVVELERDIERNDRTADKAMASLLETIEGATNAEAYAKIAPALSREERAKRMNEALADEGAKADYEYFTGLPPAEREKLSTEKQAFIASYRAVLTVRDTAQVLVDQLPKKREALRQALRGRAILIGFTATGATDQYPTSLHPACPGVSIIGTAVSGILTRDLWRTLPWPIAAIVTLCMGIATSFFVARLAPVPALALSALLLITYAVVNALLLFDRNNIILPAAGTVTAIGLCWSSLTLARFIIESRERRRITQRFSNYVDPALVDYVIENPEQVQLDGKVREMTVVFTDLAGFTTISEKLRERTVPIFNEYMSLMVPIIREHSGYWDKFLGDGIMFFYNGLAPLTDHAVRAIDTAMEMQLVTDRFNERLRERQLPKVAMRAGISTGEMVVGDAGSKDAKHRANNFTVLGDAVNLGARLEGANKPIGTRILINGRTAELSDAKFLLRPVGNVRVVGKLEGVQLFEPLCRIEQATDQQKRTVELCTTIVDSFADADFENCLCAARKMEEELGTTKFSQFYMRIAKEHLENPPRDFEGQIVLSEK